jgi:hypothetical protein
LNFWAVVSGGTLPAFSKVKKFGSARKSRSFDVPAFFPRSLVLCPALSLSDGVWFEAGDCASGADAAGLAEGSVCGVEGAGFAGAGVCCAALGKERKIANTKAMNSRMPNFIDKHFSPKKNHGTRIATWSF